MTFITAVRAHSHSVSVSELQAVKDSLCPLFLLSSIHHPICMHLLSNNQSDSHHSCMFVTPIQKMSVLSLDLFVQVCHHLAVSVVLKSVGLISVRCDYLCLPLSSFSFLCNNIKHGYRPKQLECVFKFSVCVSMACGNKMIICKTQSVSNLIILY